MKMRSAHRMDTGFTEFRWRGEPIRDIWAWAAERGERMVRVRETRRQLSAVTLREHVEVSEVEMPESFADGLPLFESRAGGTVTRELL